MTGNLRPSRASLTCGSGYRAGTRPGSDRAVRGACAESYPPCLRHARRPSAAEDVVQEAFLGLYQRWSKLRDTASAPGYLRASVLNGCRMVLRSSGRRDDRVARIARGLPWESGEATALVSEEYRHLLRGIQALPPRQREALVLRYYIDLSEEETARSMGVRRGTVKSATF